MSANPRARPTATGVLVLDQRFEIDDLYQVRAAVAAHAAELGLAAELANDVVIAVHELASNSVRHGPGRGRLRIWTDQQALTCEVADGIRAAQDDAGSPTESAALEPTDSPLPWPVESGHGLWLVGKVADHHAVCLDGHGATATVTFLLRH
ncbi:MAG TPA: ATP-binding protein [Streptosporangiaceae bacterium]|nr:ATP-binding protein [Streptosporangiaceae bacterium]